MDSFTTRCWLEWWANPFLLLGSVEARITINAGEPDWTARGQLASDEDREEFDLFYDIDPVFTVRFEDESVIVVELHAIDDSNQFTLTECT